MYKATITNIQTAFKEIKYFYPDEWEGDYRLYAREAFLPTGRNVCSICL